ncbi:hypothetical protein BDY24DRAFT_418413 [Mrakia frigida]|uniref:DUF6534 domain-containing protein n=1 Tax=Mrakia frigida TaxID=29902 RepID=UPI003FCBF34D
MAPLPPPSSHELFGRSVVLPSSIAYPADFTPLVLGNWVSHFLSGTILVQACSYRQLHRKDSRWIKIPLYAIFAANLLLEALTLSRELKVFGTFYGDFDFMVDFHNRVEDIWLGFLSVTITASVQLFLVVRTFRFKNYDEYSKVNRFQYLDTEPYPLLQLIWLVSGIAADSFICISMSWGLHKAKTGNKNSNGFLQLVINNSLRNGSVLVGAQILCFALYFAASASWTEFALSLLPRLATISLLSSIASPREAARIQAKRNTSAPWENNHAPDPDEKEEKRRRVSFGAPCVFKHTISSALKKDRRKSSSSSIQGKVRRCPTKRKSSYSLNSGVSVEMTSMIEVEEGWVEEKEGGRERKMGNSVRIEGPLTCSSTANNVLRRSSATPSFTLGLPSGHVRSIQTGTYDPDMDEYDLPIISMDMDESSREEGFREGGG